MQIVNGILGLRNQRPRSSPIKQFSEQVTRNMCDRLLRRKYDVVLVRQRRFVLALRCLVSVDCSRPLIYIYAQPAVRLCADIYEWNRRYSKTSCVRRNIALKLKLERREEVPLEAKYAYGYFIPWCGYIYVSMYLNLSFNAFRNVNSAHTSLHSIPHMWIARIASICYIARPGLGSCTYLAPRSSQQQQHHQASQSLRLWCGVVLQHLGIAVRLFGGSSKAYANLFSYIVCAKATTHNVYTIYFVASHVEGIYCTKSVKNIILWRLCAIANRQLVLCNIWIEESISWWLRW